MNLLYKLPFVIFPLIIFLDTFGSPIRTDKKNCNPWLKAAKCRRAFKGKWNRTAGPNELKTFYICNGRGNDGQVIDPWRKIKKCGVEEYWKTKKYDGNVGTTVYGESRQKVVCGRANGDSEQIEGSVSERHKKLVMQERSDEAKRYRCTDREIEYAWNNLSHRENHGSYYMKCSSSIIEGSKIVLNGNTYRCNNGILVKQEV